VYKGSPWSFSRVSADLDDHPVWLCRLLLLMRLLDVVVVWVLLHHQVLAVRVAVAAG
jgi:hypothetical protein